jgi:hypothetical protein
MADNTYTPPSSAYQAQLEAERRKAEFDAQANMNAAQKEHALEMGAICSQGQDNFGKNEFDDASQFVAENFGDRTTALTLALRGTDNPDKVVMELAKKSASELKAIARGNDGRLLATIGKIEAQVAPNQTFMNDVPNWKHIGPKGRVSRDVFESGASDNLSDERWSKAFDQHSRFAKKWGK